MILPAEIVIEILIALLFSALFSASEIAFVSSNKLLFELEKKRRSLTVRILNIFYTHPHQFLSSLLAGKCMALVIYGLLMAGLLKPFLECYLSGGDILFLFCQSVIATAFILLAGEFIPKTIGRMNPNLFLAVFAVPLYGIYLILYPVSNFIALLSGFILKVFGMKLSVREEKTFGRDDLNYFIQKTIDESPENAELDQEVRLFQNAMEFSAVKIRDCMVPRTEIVAVEKAASISELTALFVKTGLSKIIVYQNDIDNITGYIHSSELFVQPSDWTQSINSLPVVPENMTANKLMKNMLAEKKSMAVVVDEFGGTSGIITLEDLVEEIFGEIEDEHDTKLLVSKKINADEYILSGRMEIDRVNEEFGLDIPESDEYMTIAGYILNHYQTFPKPNEIINIGRFGFKIIKVTRTKIELVRLKIN
ncbi:MAG: hemolysin family protein [Dysgonamonadaceae bacterium]|jgi:CBS domain containing-hemolysin-like protein|nr:hemolysin family protein [Dysgonamonadaceae bacterium]